MKLVHVIITYSLTVGGVVSIMLPSTANATFKWYSNSIILELHFNTFNIAISITLSTKNCLIEEFFLQFLNHSLIFNPFFSMNSAISSRTASSPSQWKIP